VTLWLGLALAALSAVAGNLGSLFRQRGAVEAPDIDVRHPLRSAIGLFRSKWWTIGYLIAFGAWGLHVSALSLAALSLVQAVLAGGIVFLAVLAERFFGFEVQRRQWVGIILAAAGLAILAATGEARSGQGSASYSVPAMALCESLLVGVAAWLILSQRSERLRGQRGVLLGAAAGFLFTATHVALKATTGKLDHDIAAVALDPYLLIALGGAIVAFFASARSLQIGPAVPVIAVTSIVGNASSILAGMVVFGDPVGSTPAVVAVRIVGFLLVIVAAALIPAPVRAHWAARRRARKSADQVPAAA
jgi:multidrug transporter EmrE-like cation transporter